MRAFRAASLTGAMLGLVSARSLHIISMFLSRLSESFELSRKAALPMIPRVFRARYDALLFRSSIISFIELIISIGIFSFKTSFIEREFTQMDEYNQHELIFEFKPEIFIITGYVI